MIGILISATFFAMVAANLWFGLAQGRIFGRYGIVTRGDNPYYFWRAVVLSGVCTVLFGVVLLTLLDSRDFQPVLRLLHCKEPLANCVR